MTKDLDFTIGEEEMKGYALMFEQRQKDDAMRREFAECMRKLGYAVIFNGGGHGSAHIVGEKSDRSGSGLIKIGKCVTFDVYKGEIYPDWGEVQGGPFDDINKAVNCYDAELKRRGIRTNV